MGNSVIYRPAYDAEVEYLESTGTQWIDTGVYPNSATSFELKETLTAGRFMFGCWDYDVDNAVAYIITGEASATGVLFYRNAGTTNNMVLNYDCGGLHIYSFRNKKLYVDNVEIGDLPTQTDTERLEHSIYLFNRNANGGPTLEQPTNARIHSFQVTEDGALIRDYIPVRIGSTGYMYDKVTKQLFANKGTGNFILGNDVVNAVISQQRCVFYSPMYDAQVEYLASTGTQWIDTKAENCKTFKFRFKALNAAADLKIFGNSVAYPKLANFTLYQSLFRGTSIPVESNTWYDVEIQELNPPTLKITKGVEVSTGTLPYSGNRKPNTSYGTELPIFGIIESHSNGPFYTGSYFINRTDKYMQNETYFSYFQAFDENGVLIRDFIPVRKGQVGYMYDKVSKQLFTNKGTGSFILGSDTNDAVASQRSVGFERIY